MKDIKQTESDTLAGNLTEDTLDHSVLSVAKKREKFMRGLNPMGGIFRVHGVPSGTKKMRQLKFRQG